MRNLSNILKNLPRYFRIYQADARLALKLAATGRIHQFQEIRALRAFLREFQVDCVFDVGANRGQYATMLRRDVRFNGTIISFEPASETFAALARAMHRDRNWFAYNIALSDSEGTASFHVTASDQCSSLNTPSEDIPDIMSDASKVIGTIEVNLNKLDNLFYDLQKEHAWKRPYLKLDTQGHDLQVIKGAKECLNSFLGIQTELAVKMIYEGATDYRDMIAYLENAGFVPNSFFANNRGHFPLLLELDGIFINIQLVQD